MSLPTHLTLEIVTPDHALVTEDVDEVQLPVDPRSTWVPCQATPRSSRPCAWGR